MKDSNQLVSWSQSDNFVGKLDDRESAPSGVPILRSASPIAPGRTSSRSLQLIDSTESAPPPPLATGGGPAESERPSRARGCPSGARILLLVRLRAGLLAHQRQRASQPAPIGCWARVQSVRSRARQGRPQRSGLCPVRTSQRQRHHHHLLVYRPLGFGPTQFELAGANSACSRRASIELVCGRTQSDSVAAPPRHARPLWMTKLAPV